MKTHPSNLLQVTLVCLVLFFSFSCNKDSDLLAEYVVEKPHSLLVNDVVVTLANNPIVIDPLSNDSFTEPEKVVITEVTPPKMGTAVVNEDNTITYTPDTDQTGTDEFDYSTSVTNPDNTVSKETGSVTVTVTDKTSPDSSIDWGELKAFPTAYGAGAYTSGGRGGTVYVVSNLNNSGVGSFRQAAEAKGARTIVFSVSGTIELTSTLNINNGDLTIAGQTAPDGGITLTGSWIRFYNADNVIMRYIRIRPDYNTSTEGDAVNFLNCSDVILDHVSVSWGSDEVLSVTGDSDRITIQRTLIAEGKTGSILGDSDNPGLSDNLSIHTSLYYNITHRFPNLNTTTRGDILNNVIFNWKYRLSTNMGGQKLNHINNYYSQGCLTEWDSNGARMRLDFKGSIPSIYTSGNLVMPTLQTSTNSNNWNMWQFFVDTNYNGTSVAGRSPLPTAFESKSSFPLLGSPLPLLTAQKAFDDVTNDVGANKRIDEFGNIKNSQDDIDAIYLSNVIKGVCVNYESGSNATYNKTPYYIAFQNKVSNTPLASHNDNYDTDKDGMPDAWEIAKFGDISKAPNGDENGNGYTNIEEYISLID